MSSDMPSIIFCWSTFSELLRIARCTARCKIPRASNFFTRVMAKGENKATLTKQLQKLLTGARLFAKNLVKLMRNSY